MSKSNKKHFDRVRRLADQRDARQIAERSQQKKDARPEWQRLKPGAL